MDNDESAPIKVEHLNEGRVQHVTLNRAEHGNALTVEMIGKLAECLEGKSQERGAVASLVSSEGDDFCVGRESPGGDLKFAAPNSRVLKGEIEDTVIRALMAVRRSQVPVVSVVQGRAVGFGCALALACDFTVASREARFALDELGYGKPPLMALSVLQDKVPMNTLAYLAYTGSELVAEDAGVQGSIVKTVEPEDVQSEIRRLASSLDKASWAVRTVKEYLANVERMPFEQRASLAVSLFASMVAGPSES